MRRKRRFALSAWWTVMSNLSKNIKTTLMLSTPTKTILNYLYQWASLLICAGLLGHSLYLFVTIPTLDFSHSFFYGQSTFLYLHSFQYIYPEAFIDSNLSFGTHTDRAMRKRLRAYADSEGPAQGLHCPIMKTCLFKYTENFTTKKWKFSDKKFWYFSHSCSKHRLWVPVKTASERRF